MRRLLVLLLVALVAVGATACGGGREVAPTAEDVQGTIETGGGDGDTGAATTGTGETEAEEEDETGAEDEEQTRGDAAAGKSIYDARGCGGCHTLAAAGSTANVGPNLDEAKPSFEESAQQIANGGGGMPAYKDQLSPDEINDVAAFVTENAGK